MTTIDRHFSAYRGQLKELYNLKEGSVFLDLTLGDGGHSQEALLAGCRVVSVDVDAEAIKRAIFFVNETTPKVLEPEDFDKPYPKDFQWLILHTNFTEIGDIAKKLNLPKFDAIMVDLGPSQYQVLTPGRGFSFTADEPLDMRLDLNLGVTAKDLVNALNEGELANLFMELGDEPFAKPLARAIVKRRQDTPIETTKQLADLVSFIKKNRGGKIHPATQVFMALRMAVNLERENINVLLPQLPDLLNQGGKMGVISFHSGEDRIVKNFIKDLEEKGICHAVNEKPIIPNQNELTISQRTRSAKLRIAQKN